MRITSPREATMILAEIERRKSIPPPKFFDESFKAQTDFILSQAPRRAAQCTRRAGKSMAVGRAMFRDMYKYPGCTTLYLALTRASAKNIMWKDVVKAINRDLRLGGTPNEAELRFKLQNESEMLLAGADATKEEMEKYLGGKYRVVVIDEAGSFRQDLRKLCYEHLEPALADWEGWMGLIGTPTDNTSGLFYDVTNGKELGWEVHKWSTYDNPFMAEKWKKQIDRIVAADPRVVETPRYRRMYLNEWVIDQDALVYRFQRGRNEAPALPNDAMMHVLGIDLGFTDDTAFVLAAYSEYDPNLYFRHVYKRPGMIVRDVMTRLQDYLDKYSPHTVVIDGANKQVVEELKSRFSVPIIAADKAGKAEFIELMNSDYITGNIKYLPEAEPLAEEQLALIWDPKTIGKRREEHPSCANHLSDAALYAWRHCFQYLARARIAPPNEEEKVDAWFEEEARKIERQERQAFWERDTI